MQGSSRQHSQGLAYFNPKVEGPAIRITASKGVPETADSSRFERSRGFVGSQHKLKMVRGRTPPGPYSEQV